MNEEEILRVGDAPSAEHRVTELHGWICIHRNGGEGLMATGVVMEGHGIISMEPLLRTNLGLAEQLGEQARAMAKLCGGQAVMRTFKVVMH
jgi:hypothetical protein